MKEEIKQIIKNAVDELNEQLDDDEKIILTEDTRFVGSKSRIDSINFVTLVSIIEELIENKYSKKIYLVNEKAFSSKHSPFYSVETMSDYILELLKEA